MPKRHLQKRAQTVRDLLKSLSANYRNGCPHITEKGVRELVKPAICDRVQRANGEVFTVGASIDQPSLTPVAVRTEFSFGIGGRSVESNVELARWLKPMIEELFGRAPHRIEVVSLYTPLCAPWEPEKPKFKFQIWKTDIRAIINGSSSKSMNGQIPDLLETVPKPHFPLTTRPSFREYLDVGGVPIRPLPSLMGPSPDSVTSLFHAIGELRKNISTASQEASWPSAYDLASSAQLTVDESGTGMDVRLSVRGIDIGNVHLLRTGGHRPFAISKIKESTRELFSRCWTLPLDFSEEPLPNRLGKIGGWSQQ